jgi:NADPH2:quinone reductase
MKAVRCLQWGPPDSLVVEDIAPLQPDPGEVVISVRAAGVNFPDVLIVQNKYQVKPPLPFSPGAECSGVVKAVGKGVARFKPGDRVMASTSYGSYAEEVKADASRVAPIPEGVDFVNAATMLVAYGTAAHGLFDRAQLREGESLVVLGAAGGVGLAAVQLGKARGAYVIACASTAEKLALCREHGADALVNYVSDDLRERLRDLTGGRGVDVVCDPVGGPYTEPALRSTAWRGRLLVIGFTSGEIPKIPTNLVLLKGSALVGVFWTGFLKHEPEAFQARVRELGRLFLERRIRPHVSATMPLERAADALALMAARRATGKIVLTVGER